MDEQQKHPETTRPAIPASPPPAGGHRPGTPSGGPGEVKSHRGRNAALVVVALVVLGGVLWRWHPWGDPGGASGAAGASGASG
ncbi:MAG TPA: multidrug transporter subunit MdtA, partial [Paraburkholderia sp.]